QQEVASTSLSTTSQLNNLIEKYNKIYPDFFQKTFLTCAVGVKKKGVEDLRSHLLSLTKPGYWQFPAYQKADQADLKRVEDLIRAEIYERFKMPYQFKQVNVGWTNIKDNILRIDQNIVVARPGLKVFV